jgi:hypothetical protein
VTCGGEVVGQPVLRDIGGITVEKKKLVSRALGLAASLRGKGKKARRTWLPRCTGKKKNMSTRV